MFKAINKFITVPISIIPCSRNGAGDRLPGEAVGALCYPEERLEIITNDEGQEVVSKTRLFVLASVEVGYDDYIVYMGKEHILKSIRPFYFADGNVVFKVVHI